MKNAAAPFRYSVQHSAPVWRRAPAQLYALARHCVQTRFCAPSRQNGPAREPDVPQSAPHLPAHLPLDAGLPHVLALNAPAREASRALVCLIEHTSSMRQAQGAEYLCQEKPVDASSKAQASLFPSKRSMTMLLQRMCLWLAGIIDATRSWIALLREAFHLYGETGSATERPQASFTFRLLQPQKLLKDIVRQQPSLRGQPNRFAV